MRNYEILNILNGIQTIIKKEMPIKASFIINKNIKKLQEGAKEFEEARQKLINKYTEKDKEGKPIIKDNEYKVNDREAFQKELNELLDTENEIAIQKINIDTFGNINLTPAELIVLDFMIEEESTEK